MEKPYMCSGTKVRFQLWLYGDNKYTFVEGKTLHVFGYNDKSLLTNMCFH